MTDSRVTLETPRLILRRWREDDVVPMAAVNADPEVMRWIRDGRVRDGRGLERIVGIAQVGNNASERVMAELGMRPVRETVNPISGRRVRVSNCRQTSKQPGAERAVGSSSAV